MVHVTCVKALPGYRIAVEFSDGVRGEVGLEKELWGPAFEPLKDPDLFARVGIDDYGAVCWPNGADLDPDALHMRVVKANHVRPVG